MRVVDANVLLYAVNADSRFHEPSRAWLQSALSGGDVVGFAWVVLLAFLRLSTKPNLMDSPLTIDEAAAQVELWLSSPNAVPLEPGPGHVGRMVDMLEGLGAAGNLISDASIAALALENRGSVVTFDNDFSRFPGVSWHRPDELLHHHPHGLDR